MKRHWLYWFIILVATWIVLGRITELQNLLETLQTGQWQWVLLAAGLTVFNQWLRVAMLQSAFSVVGVASHIRDLLPVWFASIFVNVAVPAGGASGGALFIDDAVRRSQSPARAAAGVLLAQVIDYCAFTLMLVVGLAALSIKNRLQLYEVLGAGIFFAVIAGIFGILLTAFKQPNVLWLLLDQVENKGNRAAGKLHRGPLFKEGWSDEMAHGLIDAAQTIGNKPRNLDKTFAIALGVHLTNAAILGVLFLAFNQAFDLASIFAGYAITLLFWIISITPQGIGIVEGVIALVLTSLGVPPGKATVIGLAFRGLTFWLPFGLGFLMLRHVRSFRSTTKSTLEIWSDRVFILLTGLLGLVRLSSTISITLPDQIMAKSRFLTAFFHFFSKLLIH